MGPIVALVLVLCAADAAASGHYLRGNEGPYRGRVVDAVTGAPIARALIVMIWQDESDDAEDRPLLITLRETETDPDGRFVVDAPFEASLSRPGVKPLKPRIVFFARQYLPFPEKESPGIASAPFRGEGGVVKLRPWADQDDAARAYNLLFTAGSRWLGRGESPAAPSRQPALPLMDKLMADGLEHFGLRQDSQGVWRTPPRPR